MRYFKIALYTIVYSQNQNIFSERNGLSSIETSALDSIIVDAAFEYVLAGAPHTGTVGTCTVYILCATQGFNHNILYTTNS